MYELKGTIVVAGGSGFIGSHFVRHILNAYPGLKVANIDALTYPENKNNLKDVEKNSRYRFYRSDIRDLGEMERIIRKERAETVVNFAAESDNNKAVLGPLNFASTNMLGAATLLQAARQTGVKKFHQVSTCEVYGEMRLNDKTPFSENSPFRPRTPYSASKAGGDLFLKSYFTTFGYPITFSRGSNTYGPYQFPEKIIPVFAIKALRGEKLPIFRSCNFKREWLHISDHVRAIDLILRKGPPGESYNIGTGEEKSIMEVADEILGALGKSPRLKKIVPDRPGHDKRYLLNSSKLRKLGWRPAVSWQKGLKETVAWYGESEGWWRPLIKKSNAWK